jgi:hypothetical protein
MSMQEISTRYEEAAQAIHEAGQRVTHERIAVWLRARDGAGCSCRDTVALIRRYRELTEPRMDEALAAVIAKLDELPGWERDTVLARLRRHYGRTR